MLPFHKKMKGMRCAFIAQLNVHNAAANLSLPISDGGGRQTVTSYPNTCCSTTAKAGIIRHAKTKSIMIHHVTRSRLDSKSTVNYSVVSRRLKVA